MRRVLRAWLVATFSVVIVCGLGTSAALAKRPPLALTSHVSGADSALFVSLEARTVRHAVCTAALRIGHKTTRLPVLRTGAIGSGRWTFESGPGARSGRWRYIVACRHGSARTRRVLSRRTRNPAARHGGALVLARSARAAATVIERGGGIGKGSVGGNPYSFPQCTWYAWSRRQDLPHFWANALDWAKAARADGLPVSGTPVTGAIAVFQPGQYGAGAYYGHVAYVESVSGSVMTISEMNWGRTYWDQSHVHTRTIPWAGVQFILPPSAPATPPSVPSSPTSPGAFPHHVYHTCANGACGLRLHTVPSLNAPVVGMRNDGDEVDIACQTTGDAVSGLDGSSSIVWDKLADGSYASDYYIDTSGMNGAFSPPIPRCASGSPGPQPQPPGPTPPPSPGPPSPPPPTYYVHHVYGTCADGACGLKVHTAPSLSAPVTHVITDGTEVDVVCQAMGDTVSNGRASSAVWDRQTDGSWVSDFYIDTPNVGTWSPPIPQC